MNATSKLFIRIGSILMALSIVLGAFGAHTLKNILDDKMIKVYQTAVEYQVYHALGLFLIAFISSFKENKKAKLSGYFMMSGMFLFSGSLYALSLSGIKIFGVITPIGGILFIVAWILLFSAV